VVNLANPRPFLKWAGGKTQLADELVENLPPYYCGYHEPFVGGGALFFRLYRDGKIHRASISDINKELVDAYFAIRDCVEEIVELLASYPHEKEFYYNLRSQDPWKMNLPARAARTIYLNKTGYNGLYRVNRQGKFNVPFGRYKSPNYCDQDNLRAVSKALRKVEIACVPFEKVLDRAQPGDLVYFDPPYVPLSETSNFTGYQPNGFSLDDQRRLHDVCMELTEQNVSVMLSNSDTDFVQRLYAAPCFSVSEVQANRAINSNARKRGKLTELVITNCSAERARQLRLLESRIHATHGRTTADAVRAPA
jgi:DNA adenine methylase